MGTVDGKPQRKRCSCKCRCRSKKCCGQCCKRYRGIYEKSGSCCFGPLQKGRWNAQIQHQGKKYYLGSYSTREEAAKEYDRAALRFHGDNAVVNFNSMVDRADDSPIEDIKDTTNAVNMLMSLRDIKTSKPSPPPTDVKPITFPIPTIKEELPLLFTPTNSSGLRVTFLPAESSSQLRVSYCLFPVVLFLPIHHRIIQCTNATSNQVIMNYFAV